MVIKALKVGIYFANSYIVVDDSTLNSNGKYDAVMIDAGGSADKLIAKVEELNAELKYIILTHGHLDHIGGVDAVRSATGAKVIVHFDDEEMCLDSNKNLSKTFTVTPDITVIDGEEITFGTKVIKVLHTPGHTKGGISLYIEDEKVLFSGDALFRGTVGRSDLYGGNPEVLIKGIKEKIMTLPDDVVIYPGHDSETTVERERVYNMFLKN